MLHDLLLGAYGSIQLAYLCSLGVVLWLFSLRVDTVRYRGRSTDNAALQPVLLLYPVLRELEETMRTTMLAVAQTDYPVDRLRVVAIPNHDDLATIESLQRLAEEFPFLEILDVPPTTDATWEAVWAAWERNPKVYWWHEGKRSGVTDLPPKKTRQLVYALYTLAESAHDALLSYIDADSVVPVDYFQTAAAGMRQYDVVQNTNVGGNLLQTLPSSMFAMDHLTWDGSLYPHMTAGGKHPYYILGKGLFMRVSDLVQLGGFNPWLTIEDPEVGMRFWTNGRRLGVVRDPVIEEVPLTLGHGITQRKRWAAGFFQSLGSPLRSMGMKRSQRLRARLNLVPCLSLFLNPLGLGIGVALLAGGGLGGRSVLDQPLKVLVIVNITVAVALNAVNYRAAWRQTAAVLSTRRARIYYMLRVNPVFLLLHWAYWTIPLVMGFFMYLTDRGLTWERTKKTDANHRLVRDVVLSGDSTSAAAGGGASSRAAGPAGAAGSPRSKLAARSTALASVAGCGVAVIALISNAADHSQAAPIPFRAATASELARGAGLVSLGPVRHTAGSIGQPSPGLVLGAGVGRPPSVVGQATVGGPTPASHQLYVETALKVRGPSALPPVRVPDASLVLGHPPAP